MVLWWRAIAANALIIIESLIRVAKPILIRVGRRGIWEDREGDRVIEEELFADKAEIEHEERGWDKQVDAAKDIGMQVGGQIGLWRNFGLF